MRTLVIGVYQGYYIRTNTACSREGEMIEHGFGSGRLPLLEEMQEQGSKKCNITQALRSQLLLAAAHRELWSSKIADSRGEWDTHTLKVKGFSYAVPYTQEISNGWTMHEARRVPRR